MTLLATIVGYLVLGLGVVILLRTGLRAIIPTLFCPTKPYRKMYQGYQPDVTAENLDDSNPPRGGSGVPRKVCS